MSTALPLNQIVAILLLAWAWQGAEWHVSKLAEIFRRQVMHGMSKLREHL